MYRLFHEFAHRYDLHTPRDHYKDDHALVIAEALQIAPAHCRLLDIGCGTGVFLERAVEVGIDARGIDAAPEMVEIARRRVGKGRAAVGRMQELTDVSSFDMVCSLSWTIHYCNAETELHDVAQRCRRALRGGGVIVLQVANDERMDGEVVIEREPGPSDEPEDTLFIHRFSPIRDIQHRVKAEYVYASRANRELLTEQHDLRFASPSIIADCLLRAGFADVRVVNSTSISPFVLGTAI